MKILEKSGVFLCIGGILILLSLIVFAKHGILDYRILLQKEGRISVQVNQIENKNKHLEAEIKKFKTDIHYIKHVAKHDYGMTEKDEIIFKDESENKGKTQ